MLLFRKEFARTCGSGARWLLIEVTSRAVTLLSSNSAVPASDKDSVSPAVLSSLLARLSMLEISSLKRNDKAEVGLSASVADLLGYLRVSAPHLPRPLRPFSLIAGDHVTVDRTERVEGGDEDADEQRYPTPGDVLATVLEASAGSRRPTGELVEEGVVASGAIGAVVLHGFGGRPLVPLAAIAIAGVRSLNESGGSAEGGGRMRDEASLAAQALCVASTFVTAAAGAATEAKGDAKREEFINTGDDLVAMFPASILAVASEDKVDISEAT